MKDLLETLVISGGGIRGVVYIGVYKKLRELEKDNKLKINIKKFCCVSVGCFFGLLMLLGYTPDEIEDEVLRKNFSDLKDIRLSNFLNKYGLDSGKNVLTWIETLIIKKGFSKNITFKELYDSTGVSLEVLATNLVKYKYTIFNELNTPNYEVTKAIRMSISIPFVFTAEKYKNEIHVDGGLINNYPIYLFQNLDHLLGLKIVSHGELSGHEVNNNIHEFDTFISHVFACYMLEKQRNLMLNEDYKRHTIFIPTNEITQSINFSMKKEDKVKLIKLGYDAASEFFQRP